MCIDKEKNNICCCIFSIITSLIAAAGIAAIFYTGLITTITTLIYITLVVGILTILYILFSIYCKRKCRTIIDSCLLSSAIGAIITSIFALTSTSLATFSLAVAILIGAVAFFLVSNLINIFNAIFEKIYNNRCDD